MFIFFSCNNEKDDNLIIDEIPDNPLLVLSIDNVSDLDYKTINFISKSTNLNFDDINLLNPYLVSTLPTHQYPINVEPQRWYNAGVFLQTTNKGSHLSFNEFNTKLYAGQNTQDNATYVKPKQYRTVFWPSHIPWGLTPNMSMVETTMLVCSFRADAKK